MRDNYEGYWGASDREPKITQQGYLTLSRLSKLLKKDVKKYLLERARYVQEWQRNWRTLS
jgi:hypothetical protein